jgi:uncharacterized membrane protein YeaQ/YmgE (transglycosylase-associated protein family)
MIGTFISGLIVGLIAKLLMPGRDPGGFFVTALIGVAGAYAGYYVGHALGMYQQGQSAGWLMSIVGTMLLLGVYRLVLHPKEIAHHP